MLETKSVLDIVISTRVIPNIAPPNSARLPLKYESLILRAALSSTRMAPSVLFSKRLFFTPQVLLLTTTAPLLTDAVFSVKSEPSSVSELYLSAETIASAQFLVNFDPEMLPSLPVSVIRLLSAEHPFQPLTSSSLLSIAKFPSGHCFLCTLH